jgi:NitT/TauT family transport system ATP-binding protein
MSDRLRSNGDQPGEGLTVHDASLTYQARGRRTQALAGCTLRVEEGTRACLIGPSGCGKSTLLRMIADLVRGGTGTVSIGGLTPHQARVRGIYGYVGQGPGLLPWRSVAANVGLGLEAAGVATRERRRRVAEVLDLVDLARFADRLPHELSGGMRQRAAIGRALALRPRFLLMDEPFGALDEILRERLNVELLRILQEQGSTLLLVTHSIAEAVLLSDHVFVMTARPGRVMDRLQIDFGHHRPASIREDPRFLAHEAELRRLLSAA